MGLIEKLKLLFKARQPATDIINEVKTLKSGWKSWQAWATIFGSLLSLAAVFEGVLPKSTALIIVVALTFLYNIFRGAAKADVPSQKPFFKTSEWWITVGTYAMTAITMLQTGGVNPNWLATAGIVLGMAMGAGQNLAGQQPTPGAVAPTETPKP